MDGFKSVSKPAPTPEIMHWLSEVLTQIEDAGAWDDGCVLRSVIIAEYGLEGLRAIERYGAIRATVATWPGAWATAREAKRRKDDIRRTMRGEFAPPWFNRGEWRG